MIQLRKNVYVVETDSQWIIYDLVLNVRLRWKYKLNYSKKNKYIIAAIGIDTSCTEQSQCSPYGAAFCPGEFPRRCTCHSYSDYDDKTELCVPKTGTPIRFNF